MTTKFYDDFLRTTVTDNPDEFSSWAEEIVAIARRRIHVVGLIYHPKPVATLRVCVGSRCLVYKLSQQSETIPDCLSYFLIERMYTFAGETVESDLILFGRDFGIDSNNINAVNLGLVASTLYAKPDLKRASLKELLALVLDDNGVKLKYENFKRTLKKEVEEEILGNLRKASDAMLVLEKKIDELHGEEMNSAKDEYDCIATFVSFGLGEFLQASQYDTTHIFVF